MNNKNLVYVVFSDVESEFSDFWGLEVESSNLLQFWGLGVES